MLIAIGTFPLNTVVKNSVRLFHSEGHTVAETKHVQEGNSDNLGKHAGAIISFEKKCE